MRPIKSPMQSRNGPLFALIGLLTWSCGGNTPKCPDTAAKDDTGIATMALPSYNDDGHLLRPDDWERWTFVGSALNLSYSDESHSLCDGGDVMSMVYLEPGAYDVFKSEGSFAQGTMTALAVYCTGTDAEPAVDGVYPTDLELLEMSVKDDAQHDDGWAYYIFGTGDVGGDASLGAWQDSSAEDSCFSCHATEAETDFVFTQFYPSLP